MQDWEAIEQIRAAIADIERLRTDRLQLLHESGALLDQIDRIDTNLKLSTAFNSSGESMICNRSSRTRPGPPFPFLMRGSSYKSVKLEYHHETYKHVKLVYCDQYTSYSFDAL